MWLKELKSFSIWLKELNLSCFPVWLKELNFSFDIDSKKWTFFEYDSKNWIFLNMTQKNRTFLFLEYDSKNWLFFNMIQRIEFFNDSQNRTTFLKTTQRIEPIFLNATSKIELLFKNTKSDFFFFWKTRKNQTIFRKIWLKELFFCFLFSKNDSNIWIFSYDSKNWTSCYEPLFNMTQRDEVLFFFFFFHFDSKNWNPLFFSKCLKELNLSFIWATFLHDSKNWIFSIWRKDFFKLTQKSWTHFFPWLEEMTLFLQNDAQNWTLSLNTTQRIEPFFLWIRRKELNPFFFEYDAEIWILFSLNTTQRIESFLFEYDAKNWKLFLKRTRRIEPSRKNCSKTWTFFFELDSKNRTLFLNVTQNLKIFGWKIVKTLNSFQKITTQRIDFFSKKWCKVFFFWKKSDSKNGTFLKIWLSNKNMTQIIEPFLLWLGELFF